MALAQDELNNIYTNLFDMYASSIHLNRMYLAHAAQDVVTSWGARTCWEG